MTDVQQQLAPAAPEISAPPMQPTVHPLHSHWALWYCPDTWKLLDPKLKNADWADVNKAHTNCVDAITTVEEMWSILNALPTIDKCGARDTFMLYRDGCTPFWEDPAFAAGDIIGVTFESSSSTQLQKADEFLAGLAMLVLGEVITVERLAGKTNVCNGIRWSNRDKKGVRFELWTTDTAQREGVLQAIEKLGNELQLGTIKPVVETFASKNASK
jgi:hypothetical protein